MVVDIRVEPNLGKGNRKIDNWHAAVSMCSSIALLGCQYEPHRHLSDMHNPLRVFSTCSAILYGRPKGIGNWEYLSRRTYGCYYQEKT
eukprot:2770457-Amphidinium_carterae.1